MNTKKRLIEKFCLKTDLATYDPYDIWKTKLGIWVKDLYNFNRLMGLGPSIVMTILDLIFNSRLRGVYSKQEFPIVRAQSSLILINLYKENKNPEYLDFAKCHIDWLLKNYSKGYNGIGWGLGFTWPALKGFIYDKNMPFTTHTPYCLEALDSYIELTGDYSYIEFLLKIYDFYELDVEKMYEDCSCMAISYGPLRDRIITNAVSYTLFAYSIFLKYLPNRKKEIQVKRLKLFEFIRKKQLSNGSWIYSPDSENSFIDCFHSCFVLKNIFKSNKISEIPNSKEVFEKGLTYVRNEFLDESTGLYKRFALSNKPSISKYDLYDNAEVLYLMALIKDVKEFERLNEVIQKNFLENDRIYSMIDVFGKKRNKNTMRWAVIPYLNALSIEKN